MTSLPQPPTDSKPLPLIVAINHNFSLQFHIADGVHWYAILDWIAGLTGETNPQAISSIWKQFKKQSGISNPTLKNETSISNRTLKLPYVASDGKTYQRDFVQDEILYKFAAYARATADRPTLSVIKNYLAKAGAFTDKVRLAETANKPSLEQRDKSKGVRVKWTDSLKDALVVGLVEGWVYGHATNLEYIGLFGRDAKQILAERGLDKGNVRELLTEQGLLIVMTAESTLETKFRQYDHQLTRNVAFGFVKQICEAFGGSVVAVQKILGYDLATGLPLLGDGL